jgi:hypothetical protein
VNEDGEDELLSVAKIKDDQAHIRAVVNIIILSFLGLGERPKLKKQTTELLIFRAFDQLYSQLILKVIHFSTEFSSVLFCCCLFVCVCVCVRACVCACACVFGGCIIPFPEKLGRSRLGFVCC